MRSRTRTGKAALGALLALAIASGAATAAAPSVADLDAAARAVGNRRDLAEHIGESIFGTEWSAEVSQISANQLGTHLIVGIRMWGVKFHHPLSQADFVAESEISAAENCDADSAAHWPRWFAFFGGVGYRDVQAHTVSLALGLAHQAAFNRNGGGIRKGCDTIGASRWIENIRDAGCGRYCDC